VADSGVVEELDPSTCTFVFTKFINAKIHSFSLFLWVIQRRNDYIFDTNIQKYFVKKSEKIFVSSNQGFVRSE
jgi:hypothetical protein